MVIKCSNFIHSAIVNCFANFGFGLERISFSKARCFAWVAILLEQPNFDIVSLRLHESAKIVKIDVFSLLLVVLSYFLKRDGTISSAA